ncbi:protein EMSY-LIKE 3-like [Vicia villosa]|uniref:protein EMSY-LIKE 3-like n=1 Tax=Vicia villosa TaxID=3911 RepID=UPI00273BFCBE|nr:protein EMSY-LIKE 3-like [Vicia villosa]XP_058748545.1 protein EMSY-LIKE 3-like [Vicia villosa]
MSSQQNPSMEPAKTSSVDPLIGKQVSTRWSPGGPFIDGDIIEYDPANGMYKVIYAANTPKEFSCWVDMKKILPEDIDWEGFDQVPSTVEQNGQDSDDDNAEKVNKSVKKITVCTQTQMRPAKPKSKSKSKTSRVKKSA